MPYTRIVRVEASSSNAPTNLHSWFTGSFSSDVSGSTCYSLNNSWDTVTRYNTVVPVFGTYEIYPSSSVGTDWIQLDEKPDIPDDPADRYTTDLEFLVSGSFTSSSFANGYFAELTKKIVEVTNDATIRLHCFSTSFNLIGGGFGNKDGFRYYESSSISYDKDDDDDIERVHVLKDACIKRAKLDLGVTPFTQE